MKKKFKMVMTAEIELEDVDDLTTMNPFVMLATASDSNATLEVFDEDGELVTKEVLK